MKVVRWLAPAALLGLMAFLMLEPARRQTVTIDEVPHIGAGLSYLQRLDMRLNGEHPPLGKVLAALPLVVSGTKADYSSLQWTFSDKFFPAYFAQWAFGEWVLGKWNPRQPTVAAARMPMLALTLLLGAVLYACALQLGGLSGALLVLTVFVSAPVFLTFGPLVLTDIPVALFVVLTMWRFAKLWQSPVRSNIVWFGLALAAALLSKFSAPVVLIAIALTLRYSRFRPLAGEPAKPVLRPLLQGIGVAAAVVYFVYFVFSWNQPMDVQHRIGEGPVAAAIGRILMPPWLFLRGAAMVIFTSSRPAYILGETHAQGLPVYFPFVTLLKSPPGFLGLLGLAVILGRPVIPDAQRWLWRTIWISAVVFTAVCLLSRLNISLRHFTLPLACFMLMLAPLPRRIAAIRQENGRRGTALAGLTIVLAASSVISAVSAYPHLLPYTNVLAMGTPAYRLFGDSNVDWNHALGEARRFAEAKGGTNLLVDAYGLSDPATEIPGAQLWDCQSPAPEQAGRWAVVSANALIESHNCAWLIPHIAEPLAGGSMYALRLPSPIPDPGSPQGPPRPSAHKKLFAIPVDLRSVMIEITRDPARLPAAFAELEWQLAPTANTDDLYPPKEPVEWPWNRKR